MIDIIETVTPTHYFIDEVGEKILYSLVEDDVFQKIDSEWVWVDNIKEYIKLGLDNPYNYLALTK